jgi:hypothetical protein
MDVPSHPFAFKLRDELIILMELEISQFNAPGYLIEPVAAAQGTSDVDGGDDAGRLSNRCLVCGCRATAKSDTASWFS